MSIEMFAVFNPDIGFIHVTRHSGTHIVFLTSGSHPSWPQKGEEISYQFGTADRKRILEDRTRALDHITKAFGKESIKLILYWNPGMPEVKDISIEGAQYILDKYTQEIELYWKGREYVEKAQNHS